MYDDWEKNGVWVTPYCDLDPAFIDLPAMKADPMKPDICVHLDWMKDDTHNQKFNSTALEIVVEAFANGNYFNPTGSLGVNLHIDNGHKFHNGSYPPVEYGGYENTHKVQS